MNPVASDFIVDQELEEQRFKITEKKMQMIHLQAKIDALGVFNSKKSFSLFEKFYTCQRIFFILVNLKELDEYNEEAESAERRQEFESDLHQNLELWDSLMKVNRKFFS